MAPTLADQDRLMLAMRLLYEAKAANRPIDSVENDRAKFNRYFDAPAPDEWMNRELGTRAAERRDRPRRRHVGRTLDADRHNRMRQ